MKIEDSISISELSEKCQELLHENSELKEEIRTLKTRLVISEARYLGGEIPGKESEFEIIAPQTPEVSPQGMSKSAEEGEKIRLFMSLFKGRDDVYARRWENKKKETSGYSPSCLNEWKPVCVKPKGTCTVCTHKAYVALTEKIIDDHLRGKIVAGIYPILPDETCWFLAIDFDDGEWQKDISVLREVCAEFDIPVAIERSRSGNGSHAWLFFKRPIAASLARKFGTSLLTYSMQNRHEITFKSYDRFFPSQDTMPKGGLGNLIALPLQKEARKAKNSEFIDQSFEPYADQWAFLDTIRSLSEDDVLTLTSKLGQGNELGVLKIDEEETQKPWETIKVKLLKTDFPRQIEIAKANMVFVPKAGISQRALNRLKRLAAFKNPEFYRNQAMRMPTYGKSRIICCADDTAEYLYLPRGCEQDLRAVFAEQAVVVNCLDKTNHGKRIDVTFNGNLRDEQPQAVDKLLEHDIGVLSGTTAFGNPAAVHLKRMPKAPSRWTHGHH